MTRLLLPPLLALISNLLGAPQESETQKPAMDKLGPYRIGADAELIKKLPDYKDDPTRDDEKAGVKAGKIIALLYDQPAIQRFFFKEGRLHRVSIIFGEAAFGEEQAKALVAREWGDPGPKVEVGESKAYVWKGPEAMIAIFPAQGGRTMISLSSTK